MNGYLLGKTNNMFVRYRYDVKSSLSPSNQANHLSIQISDPVSSALEFSKANSFTPPNCPPAKYNGECHMNFLRKMQASFSWDWGLTAPSSGIWKSVTLDVYRDAIVRDITIKMTLQGSNVWEIVIGVYLEKGTSPSSMRGEVKATMEDVPFQSKAAQVNGKTDEKGELVIEIEMTVQASDVELWWPNGFGDQKLYDLTVTFQPDSQPNDVLVNEQSSKTISIGFRTIDLIQDPIGKLKYCKDIKLIQILSVN